MSDLKNVCVVTGTRAEYGLLKHLMGEIKASRTLNLQLIVTGSHLSEKYGNTYQEILDDGFVIDFKADIALDDDSVRGVANSTGLGVSRIADGLCQLRPDIVVLLGDRFEILAAAIAAQVCGCPIAHLHGGEITEAAIDDSIRHAITKFADLHFVAHETYRRRVIQLGEQPERVFNVGGLGVDSILKTTLMSRTELEDSLGIKFSDRNLLVTFHPVTLEQGSAEHQVSALLRSLAKLRDTTIIFTMPNADMDREVISSLIRDFCISQRNAFWFDSLGSRRYLSCLRVVDGVVGNSSSGILEAPTFKKGTINVGNRQRGRVMASSVIQCGPSEESIDEALQRLMSHEFQAHVLRTINPYGDGGASTAILETLESLNFKSLGTKSFYDVPV